MEPRVKLGWRCDHDDDRSGFTEDVKRRRVAVVVKHPEPCLLCGEPAVHYDHEGNVIKRESPPQLQLHPDDDNGASYSGGFFSGIYKCFGVLERRRNRRELERIDGDGDNPLPLCVSCEELVVLLLEMYDKVEELETKIRDKTRDAEMKKFLGEDLYGQHDEYYDYGSFRGLLFGGQQNVEKRDSRMETRKPSSNNNNNFRQEKVIMKCGLGGSNKSRRPASSYLISEADSESEAEPLDADDGTDDDDVEFKVDPLEETSSDNNRSSVENDDAQSESGTEAKGQEEEDEPDLPTNIFKTDCTKSPRVSPCRTGKQQTSRPQTRYKKIKERLNKLKSTSARRRLATTSRNDLTQNGAGASCSVDPITGNIFYSRAGTRGRGNSGVRINLEFIKQSSDSRKYKCSTCSRIVAFPTSNKTKTIIDRMTLAKHARRFHPTANGGICPVCEKPMTSMYNSDYQNHRLSHLSQSERAEATSNPKLKKEKGGRCYSRPKFPPVVTRRKITPETAPLHHDVNQCPTCGKFIARGIKGLRRHERTHLPPEERRTHLCSTCGASFVERSGLDLHIVNHHPNEGAVAGLHKCPQCKNPPRVFQTQESFLEHMRKDVHDRRRTAAVPTAQLPFACTSCPKSFETEKNLKYHVTRVHVNAALNIGTWTCQLKGCAGKFKSKEERLEHYVEAHPTSKLAVQRPTEAVACLYPNCKMRFADEASLQAHVGQEHDAQKNLSKGVMCPECGKVVTNAWGLKLHTLTHTGERRHGCHRCNVSFFDRGSLNRHLSAIHGEGPLRGTFKCEQPGCDKVFPCRRQYTDHLRGVHKVYAGGGGKGKKQAKSKNELN